jgi:hypothetical protein
MRKVIIQSFCDVCLDETAGDMENDSFTTLYFSSKPDALPDHQIDICESHWQAYSLDRLVESLRPVTPDVDDKPPMSKRGRPKGPCPVCGEQYALGSGMTLHVKKQHPEHQEELPPATYKHEPKKRKKAR